MIARQYHVNIEVAYKSNRRLLPDRLESMWNERKYHNDLQPLNMSASHWIFRPYNQGFNHMAISFRHVATTVSDALRIAKKIAEKLKEEFTIYAFVLF